MDIFSVLPAALIAIAFIFVVLYRKNTKPHGLHYEAAESLLTPAERAFFAVLHQVVPEGYLITFKVRIGDVINVRKGLERKQAFILRSKIQQKHFDFVICRNQDFSVVCCIELNDKSHETAERSKRDVFVRSACEAAKVPLLEVKAKRNYVVAELRSQMLPLLGLPSIDQSVPAQTPQEEGTDEDSFKLSTSMMAKKYGCTTEEFLQKLMSSMYAERIGNEYRLTELGAHIGGEERSHKRFGKYLVWPEDLPLPTVKTNGLTHK